MIKHFAQYIYFVSTDDGIVVTGICAVTNNALEKSADVVWERLGSGILWRKCTHALRPSCIKPYLDALQSFTTSLKINQ